MYSMSIIQANTEAQTYQELVDYVCDSHAVERTPLNQRQARAAARKAYRDLANYHDWSYYYRQRLLQTVADYDTGTVEFDYTGGAKELQLTLTGGTWPDWAAYGRVILDSVHYEVASRVSDSVLTLTETSNPGADVAAGTGYTLYRSSYPLPADFKEIGGVWEVSERYQLPFIDQRLQHDALVAYFENPDTPRHATIRATGRYLSGLEIVFGPPPAEAFTYDMLYQANPRPLAIDEYSAGTVAITSASATVTGTSTVFPTNCAGSIIRFSAGLTKPSGYYGSLDGADNPFVYQGVILSRDSDTALTLTEAMPSTIASLSGVAYTISDPLDIDTSRMLSALQLLAEAEYCRLAARQDAPLKQQLAMQALHLGMEADNSMSQAGRVLLVNSIRRATVVDS